MNRGMNPQCALVSVNFGVVIVDEFGNTGHKRRTIEVVDDPVAVRRNAKREYLEKSVSESAAFDARASLFPIEMHLEYSPPFSGTEPCASLIRAKCLHFSPEIDAAFEHSQSTCSRFRVLSSLAIGDAMGP